MQEKVTTKQDVLKNKGTIKAAILVGDSKCTDLVTLSFYDSKPIYFITNACDKICWVRKNRKFWHQQKGRQVNVPFYRLNIVDEYNAGMGNVDIADQLRLQYWIHYWIRNQKWWWAIFFGVFECSLTNSYILYRKFYQVHEKKPPLSHYDFVRQVSLAWLKPSVYWPEDSRRVSGSLASVSTSKTDTTIASSIITRRKINVKKKNSTFTNKSLDPYSGILRCRLDHSLDHLPVKNDKPEASCQLHYWILKEKKRAQLLRCSTCNATLCISCYKCFHQVPNLQTIKLVDD